MSSRADPAVSPAAPPETCGCHGGCATAPVSDAPLAVAERAPGREVFRIATMDCPSEEGDIRRALEKVAGVKGLEFMTGGADPCHRRARRRHSVGARRDPSCGVRSPARRPRGVGRA